ncbi:PKD domain-containing protein [Mucilaginibacter sp. CAU 1740]|uniref:PKD domain-containing protein n=1 Tax=Mucilaginibacter sp. CAU 1740 TaxID=3140365 RepID=UPI00325C1B9F
MKVSCFASAFLCVTLCLIIRQRVHAQITSSSGREFWVAFPTHVPDFDGQFNTLPAQLSLFITGEEDSKGHVAAGGFSTDFSVTAHQVTEIKVPRGSVYINEEEAGQVLHNRAVRVTVEAGLPGVTVYGHIFAGQRSAATLVLPVDALGGTYYSMNYPQHDTEGKNYITVVATAPNTMVYFKRGNTTLATADLKEINDVYEYLSDEDLSGVTVSTDQGDGGCQRFAAFSGSTGVYISPQGCTPRSLDPLYQQCLPPESWGREYGYVPFSTSSPDFTGPVRTAGQLLRIMAGSYYTEVSIDGQKVASLNPGEYYTTPQPLTKPAHISSNYPVMVAQFALSQSCSNSNGSNKGYSDPDMVLLNPVSLSIKDIAIYSSAREKISEQYVNILLPTSATGSFRINGQSPAEQFQPMSTMPGFSYLQLLLPKNAGGTFRLTAAAGFNAIAYGFGNVESYAYSAGTNLGARYQLQAYRISTGEKIDTACADDNDYEFWLTLPYDSPDILFETDGYTLRYQGHPPILGERDGVTTYSYIMWKLLPFNNPGEHKITVTADYPNGHHNCGLDKDIINGTFQVLDGPAVAFRSEKDDCGLNVGFTDKTPGLTAGAKWEWDFGDPQSKEKNRSSLQNPFHQYPSPGKFEVTLSVVNAFGCQAIKKQIVEIGPSVEPVFAWASPACEGKQVTFSDKTPADIAFVIKNRTWDFGDGTTLVSDQPEIKHLYNRAGNYTAKMTLTGQSGCVSSPVSANIAVQSRPTVSFELPDACASEVPVTFHASPAATNGDNDVISYAWNFSDPFADPANPNSAFSPDASHIFTRAGKYQISLTVSRASGCDTTISRELSVSSGDPNALLEANGSDKICSGTPLVVRNLSGVSGPGKISRLVIFFDQDTSPGDSVVISSPEYGQLIEHSYPANKTGETLQYNIRYLAYSGKSCFSLNSLEISILPEPELYFDAVSPLCSTASAVRITDAGERHHMPAVSVFFTGKGVSTDGLFDPFLAGEGSHTITYHFVGENGCTQTIDRDILVEKPPRVSAADITVLEGQSATLVPQYSGTNLSYEWSPAAYLNKPDIAYPKIYPAASTEYRIRVCNGTCSAETTIHVKVLYRPKPANTFTPNGDGYNDLWQISNIEDYPNAQISIFNRYGMLLYESKGIYRPWDGRFNGTVVPAGTYYYVIKTDHRIKDISGYLVLIK